MQQNQRELAYEWMRQRQKKSHGRRSVGRPISTAVYRSPLGPVLYVLEDKVRRVVKVGCTEAANLADRFGNIVVDQRKVTDKYEIHFLGWIAGDRAAERELLLRLRKTGSGYLGAEWFRANRVVMRIIGKLGLQRPARPWVAKWERGMNEGDRHKRIDREAPVVPTVECPKCGEHLDARKMMSLAGTALATVREVKSGGNKGGRPRIYTHGTGCPCWRCTHPRKGQADVKAT